MVIVQGPRYTINAEDISYTKVELVNKLYFLLVYMKNEESMCIQKYSRKEHADSERLALGKYLSECHVFGLYEVRNNEYWAKMQLLDG